MGKETDVVVMDGCRHVSVPLALALALLGFRVSLCDTNGSTPMNDSHV